MVMLTYRIPDSIRQIALQGEFDEFDLNVFFSAKGKDEEARFTYENEVQKWLDLIRGAHLPSGVDDLKLGQERRPPMPYSDTRLMNVLSHTMWFLPNVAACDAMANLLAQKQNSFYHKYKIIVCAGPKAGIGLDALKPVQNAMADPLRTNNHHPPPAASSQPASNHSPMETGTFFMLRKLKKPGVLFSGGVSRSVTLGGRWRYRRTHHHEAGMLCFRFRTGPRLRQISITPAAWISRRQPRKIGGGLYQFSARPRL
jgi:hypothetical protein